MLSDYGQNYKSVQFVNVENTVYTKDAIVLLSHGNDEEFPSFGVIEKLYVKISSDMKADISHFTIIVSKIQIRNFNKHFQAFTLSHAV